MSGEHQRGTVGQAGHVAETDEIELYYDDVVIDSETLGLKIESIVRETCSEKLPDVGDDEELSIEYITVLPSTGQITVEYTVLG